MGQSEAALISAAQGLREVLSSVIKHLLVSHHGLSPGDVIGIPAFPSNTPVPALHRLCLQTVQ